MDQGFKHFSHVHNLIMHEMPEGIEVSCSGCHSTAIGTVYVCWQCNFFMHDQCYQATRSLKHPSHPPHPLTLVPYPTYQTNSFYCNSCQSVGIGFSYSCAECEFNLHVQCAYPIARATSFKNANLFQELVPQGWNRMQDSNIDHHVPVTTNYPIPSAQDHWKPQNMPSASIPTNFPIPSVHDPSPAQNMPSDSIPTNYPIPSAQDPLPPQNLLSGSIPTNYPIPSVQDPFPPQNMPSDSIPTNFPIPSAQNPLTPQNGPSASITSAQDPSTPQHMPSVSIPTNYPVPSAQDPLTPQNRPSDSIPSNYPIPSAQDPLTSQNIPSDSIPTNYSIPSMQDPSTPPSMPSVSIPTISINSSAEYTFTEQTGPSVSVPTNYSHNLVPSAQDPSMHQNKPYVSIPTNQSDPITLSRDPSVPQNGLKDEELIMHFSHHHKLSRVYLQNDEDGEDKEENEEDEEEEVENEEDEEEVENEEEEVENEENEEEVENEEENEEEDEEEKEVEDVELICSGCEETLVGKGYSCVEPDCNFHLYESCYQLKREIHHKSHPEHPLTLLTLAPHDNKDGDFTCKACFNDGTGFYYHCSICKLDLHVKCASLLESVKREDHEHMLPLLYTFPEEYQNCAFYCNVCREEVPKDHWVYYCEPCDYGTHSSCVDHEERERDVILDPQARLQMLQFQMQMARQQAQFMASMGSSLASLA